VQDTYVSEPRKSRSQKHGDANLNYPPGTPTEEILELTLRDFILELEEKIHTGGLGSLKVCSDGIFMTVRVF
jgi:bromodomain adjacent to zinc finger domain protein 1A